MPASDMELLHLSTMLPGHRVQREATGAIRVSPTTTKGGAKSGEAFGQLRDYKKRAGGKAFDSNTGFAIGPNLRVYSPDAAWVSQARIDALSPDDIEGFWPLSPDIIIEVRSSRDRFADTIDKIATFIERGTRYAVAVDPFSREVVERGERPADLALDFDAIVDA